MAVVLVIAGLLIGMVAPLLGRVLENNRTAATLAHMEAIQDAIVIFVRANGRIPCPGQPEDTPLGDERRSAPNAPPSCTGNDQDDGIVPFRVLGLPEDTARDGYKNFFTYHVAEDFADNGLDSDITAGTGFCSETSSLTIVDENGDDLAPGQEVAYVLVSHGENGHGHYTAGVSNPTSVSSNSLEGENVINSGGTNDDDTFVNAAPLNEDVTGGPYDDTVRWATRDQIAAQVQEFGCP